MQEANNFQQLQLDALQKEGKEDKNIRLGGFASTFNNQVETAIEQLKNTKGGICCWK